VVESDEETNNIDHKSIRLRHLKNEKHAPSSVIIPREHSAPPMGLANSFSAYLKNSKTVGEARVIQKLKQIKRKPNFSIDDRSSDKLSFIQSFKVNGIRSIAKISEVSAKSIYFGSSEESEGRFQINDLYLEEPELQLRRAAALIKAELNKAMQGQIPHSKKVSSSHLRFNESIKRSAAPVSLYT